MALEPATSELVFRGRDFTVIASDNEEISVGQDGLHSVGQRRELDCGDTAGFVTVRIIVQRAVRRIVDDAVVEIVCSGNVRTFVATRPDDVFGQKI